jgi:hypothetical protein
MRADDFAAHHGRQPALLLRFGAERQDRAHDRPQLTVDAERQAVVPAAVADRFEDHDRGHQIGAAAAVGRRHDQAEQAEVGRGRPQVPPVRRVDGAAGIAVGKVDGERLGGEGAGPRALSHLVFGQ